MTARETGKRIYRIRRIRRAAPAVRKKERTVPVLPAAAASLGILFAAACTPMTQPGTDELIAVNTGDMLIRFADSFAVLFVYISLFFFIGFSAAGKPFAYLMCLFKGMGAGMLAAHILRSGGVISYAGILMYEVLGTGAAVIAAGESVRLSGRIAARAFTSTNEKDEPVSLAPYLIQFGKIMAAAVITAAVYAVFS